VVFNTDGCEGKAEEIRFLEHVEVLTNIAYTFRGALEMHLTSPSGGHSFVRDTQNPMRPDYMCPLMSLTQDIGLSTLLLRLSWIYYLGRYMSDVVAVTY
jgi:hypothetical protein